VILVLLLLLILLVLAALAATGVVPGLSKVFGADKPRDLGVRPTQADAGAVVKRMGYKLDNQPTATKPSDYRQAYSGKVNLDQDFSQAEISALLTYNHVSWWLLQDVQVKIHPDGVVEASLRLDTTGINWTPDGDVPTGIMRYLPAVMPDELPLYMKGTMFATGPKTVRMDFQALQIGRVPVPASVLQDNEGRANKYVNDRIAGITGLNIQELSFKDGKVHFKGTYPQEFKRLPIKP
jgi:hypothetical protein